MVLAIRLAVLFILSNIFLLARADFGSVPLFLSVFALYLFLIMSPGKTGNPKTKTLEKGYRIITSSGIMIVLELVFLTVMGILQKISFTEFLLNLAVSYAVIGLYYLSGFWRVAVRSRQIGITGRILMFFIWWIFPLNLLLIIKWCRTVRYEIIYENEKEALDNARAEKQVCRTRYPLVLVHGIFFRDWQLLNYWGRIPIELKRNGANIYYGRQQSSLAIAKSAGELKKEIEEILRKTGSEKVNIIAHSKGGLDARYMISKLGMKDKVASLTTINTPHRGCVFADFLLEKIPLGLQRFVGRQYNRIFSMIGDTSPDFMEGVYDLRASSCLRFNAEVPDAEGVLYQSVMSKIRNPFKAIFPLSAVYFLARHFDGDNDGLVGVESAVWGNYLGLLESNFNGISHGDMIDLTRKNIRDFNVEEFYVQIVSELKQKGF